MSPPKRITIIAAASLPFWYLFFVSQGWPRRMVAGACTFALAAVLLIAVYLARKAEQNKSKPQ